MIPLIQDKNNPNISVICPVYNTEKYLVRCFDSVLEQTFTNFEFIIINDCSTDKSGLICLEYSIKDQRIVYIQNESNSGTSITRNYGLKIAKGNYITWIDSDDWVDNDWLETLFINITTYNADISIIRKRNVYKNIKIKIKSDINEILIFNNSEALKNLIECKYISNSLWDKLIRKDLYNGINFPNRKCEDASIMHILLFRANLIVYSKKIKYNYFYRLDSSEHQYSLNLEYDRFLMLKERCNFINNINLPILYKIQINNTFDQGLRILLMTLFSNTNNYENKSLEELKIWMDRLINISNNELINLNRYNLINGNIIQKLYVYLWYEYLNKFKYILKYNLPFVVFLVRSVKSFFKGQ